MKLHRINAVIVRHVYESRRNFDRVVDMIWWPVLDIVMWGFFTVYLAHSNRLQPNVVSCLLGGDNSVGDVLQLSARHGGWIHRRALVPQPYQPVLDAVDAG